VSDYTVIAEAGGALVSVLWDAIRVDPVVNALIPNQANISLRSPYDLRADNSVRLSLYLYRILEDPYTKNQVPQPAGTRRLRDAPLTLDLFYLVTPLVGPPEEQQIVLGKVMQVFHDRAILQGTDLTPGMAAAGEELRIVLNPVSLEETAEVWQALEMSYRLAVCYAVRVAILDSTRTRVAQPVVARSSEYAGA
jgi:hypothetical protein